jgi:hypothetical protein
MTPSPFRPAPPHAPLLSKIIVEEKKAQTDELIVSIGKEKAVVDEAVEAGREDEEAAAKLAADVQAFQEECSHDLAAAEPIIQEAEAALNSLDKASLGELKSFGSPAAEIVQVCGPPAGAVQRSNAHRDQVQPATGAKSPGFATPHIPCGKLHSICTSAHGCGSLAFAR